MSWRENIDRVVDTVLLHYPSTKDERNKVRADIRNGLNYSSPDTRCAYMGEYFKQRACETAGVLTQVLDVSKVRPAAMLP